MWKKIVLAVVISTIVLSVAAGSIYASQNKTTVGNEALVKGFTGYENYSTNEGSQNCSGNSGNSCNQEHMNNQQHMNMQMNNNKSTEIRSNDCHENESNDNGNKNQNCSGHAEMHAEMH